MSHIFRVVPWVAGQRQIVAARALSPGTVAWKAATSKGDGLMLRTPHMHTIQFGEDQHLDVAASCPGAELTQHCCNPNGRLLFDGTRSVALEICKPIAEGEPFSFNYNTSEWEMADPFECQCGQPNCCGRVAGYSKLGSRQQRAIAADLSPFVRTRAVNAGHYFVHRVPRSKLFELQRNQSHEEEEEEEERARGSQHHGQQR